MHQQSNSDAFGASLQRKSVRQLHSPALNVHGCMYGCMYGVGCRIVLCSVAII